MKTEDRPEIKEEVKPANAAADTAGPKRKPLLFVVGAIAIVAALFFGIRFWIYAQSHVGTDDAYITSELIQIAPQVSGTVQKVLVHENDRVKAGQLLVVLEDSTYKTALEQAQANLDLALAQASGAKSSTTLTTASGNAQIQQAKGVVEESTGGVASAIAQANWAQAAVSTAKANAQSGQAAVAGAQSAISQAVANVGKAKASVDGAVAAVNSARSGVASAQAGLSSTRATYDKSSKDYERAQTLYSQGAVSAQEADTARAAVDVAKAQVESAEQSVSAAQSAVQQRQSELAASRQALTAAQSGVTQARAQLSAAQSNASALTDMVRQAADQAILAQKNILSARGKGSQALGTLNQAKTSGDQVQVSKSAETQALARVEQARATLRAAQINLNWSKIYAPATGTVSKKSVSAGALVQPGTPLMTLVPDEQMWVQANYKETQLAAVREGLKAEINVDAIPDHSFTGTVQSISKGTGQTFALLPADNATGNFTKVVQRVPVKIVLDPGQRDLDRLRAGMSVSVTIQTR